MDVPTLSIVMPMRNAMPFLPAAIESILEQTYVDWELVIGDDASGDGSYACAAAYARQDPRIRLLRGECWRGPVGSSDWVARAARADLIARMDADDISAPRRLERQIAVMAAHPAAVLVGSVFDMIDARGRPIRAADRRVLAMKRKTPQIAHSSIMFRRDAFGQVGGYRPGTDYFEDADLYRRMLAVGDLIVISDPLLSYRFAGTSARLRDDRETVYRSLDIMADVLAERAPSTTSPMQLAPEVFRTVGTTRLWSRRHPGVLLAMLRRMKLRPLRRSLPHLGWALAATACPPLARQFVRTRLAWRNWRARLTVSPGHAYRWRPDLPLVDLGDVP